MFYRAKPLEVKLLLSGTIVSQAVASQAIAGKNIAGQLLKVDL